MLGLGEYLSQVEQSKQQNEQNPEVPHPFQSGVHMAMQGIRQSLGQNVPQNPMAEALRRFSIGIGQPSENRLEGIKNSIQSGIEGYNEARAQEAQMNSQLYLEAVRQQEAEREYMRRMQEAEGRQMMHQQNLEEKQRYHQESLDEKRRHHELMNQYQLASLANKKKDEDEKLGAEAVSGLYGVEYIPLNSLTKTAEREWSKKATEEEATLDANKKSLHSLKEMEKIIKKYPDIGSSFMNAIAEAESGGPSFLTLLSRQFMREKDKEKLTAIQELKKLNASIRYDIIKGMSGSKATDVMKKVIADATASGLSTDEAFQYVANDLMKSAEHKIKKIKVIQDAQKKGMKPLFSMMEDGEELEDQNSPNSLNKSNALPENPSVPSVPSVLSSSVRIKLPNGQTGSIPANKLQDFISRGAVQVE